MSRRRSRSARVQEAEAAAAISHAPDSRAEGPASRAPVAAADTDASDAPGADAPDAPGADTPDTPDTPTPVLRARGLRRAYGTDAGRVAALDGVDVDIAAGAFTAIMGPSGSGKSTLLHVLAGLDAVDSGTVTLDGIELTGLRDDALTRLRRDRVGFIFQSFNLLPMLTAEQNILLPLQLAGRRADRERFGRIVEELGLAERLQHRPAQLSGGQVQRVAIARALIGSPAIIFADEPTGNLDSRTTADVLDVLRRCVDEFGQSIVMVTHERDAACRADRILTLADGRISEDEHGPFRTGRHEAVPA